MLPNNICHLVRLRKLLWCRESATFPCSNHSSSSQINKIQRKIPTCRTQICKYYVFCSFVHLLCFRSLSSTRFATPKRTTKRSGRASVATTPSSESCLNFGPPKSNSGECVEGVGRLCKGQAQEVEDGGASVLFDYLFSYGCVGREGDPEY